MSGMINLFAGPGGLCMAADTLDIPTIGIEWDANACQTRRAAGLETIQCDVRNYGPRDFPKCNFLTAGPPCQTFTLTGNGEGRKALDTVVRLAGHMETGRAFQAELDALTDERTGLILEPLRWILSALRSGFAYEHVVLEQVPQALPVWEEFARIMRVVGYNVVAGVLHAERYGVPQTRKRAILIASLNHPVKLPEPQYLPYRANAYNDCPTMATVIDRNEPFTMISNYGTGGDASKRGRRDWDEPAFTVTGKINRNRIVARDGRELDRLSHSEAGRLQGFPADYPWSGKDIPQQIGNAAPVQLMTSVLLAAQGF